MINQYETDGEKAARLERENAALKRKVAEEKKRRDEETTMAMIWGRRRDGSLRMDAAADFSGTWD